MQSTQAVTQIHLRINQIFTPYARGRDGDMSWIKLAMGAFMTKDIVEAGKPLCDEIEETVTTFQVRSSTIMTFPTEAAPACIRIGFAFLGCSSFALGPPQLICPYFCECIG